MITELKAIANSFRVEDICNPIHFHASPNDSVYSVWETMNDICIEEGVDPIDYPFCMIKNKNGTYGYVSYDDPEAFREPVDVPVIQRADLITPEIIVPADMPILDLFPLFESNWYYFILSKNEISGFVCYPDLDKLPVKLSVFTLILRLESEMSGIIRTKLDVDEFLKALSINRRKRAEELHQKKYGEGESWKLLLCTTFADKIKVFLRNEKLHNLFHVRSKTKLNKFFHKIESIRNQIAHSDSIIEVLRTPRDFNAFLRELDNITEILSQVP